MFSTFLSFRRRTQILRRSRSCFGAALLFWVSATFFLTLGGGSATAKDPLQPIAPFINEKTLLVARVDVAQIDLDRLSKTIDGVFADALKNIGFDDASVAASQIEFEKTRASLQAQAETLLKQTSEFLGATEIFLVVQSTNVEGAGLIVAMKSASQAEKEAFIEKVEELSGDSGLTWSVYQNDYVVATPDSSAEFKAYYKKFVASPNRKASAFFSANADKIAALYCGRFRIRAVFESVLGEEADAFLALGSRSAKNAIDIFDTSFADCEAFVDASTLTANASFRFNSVANAGKMRTELKTLFDDFAILYFTQTIQNYSQLLEQPEEFNILPLMREMTRGTFRTYLPERNGVNLVFEFDLPKTLSEMNSSCVAAAALIFGTTIILPSNSYEYETVAPTAEESSDAVEIEFAE